MFVSAYFSPTVTSVRVSIGLQQQFDWNIRDSFEMINTAFSIELTPTRSCYEQRFNIIAFLAARPFWQIIVSRQLELVLAYKYKQIGHFLRNM